MYEPCVCVWQNMAIEQWTLLRKNNKIMNCVHFCYFLIFFSAFFLKRFSYFRERTWTWGGAEGGGDRES